MSEATRSVKSQWPPKPDDSGDMEALRTYLVFYRQWLRDNVATEAETISRTFTGGVTREQLIGGVAKKWSDLIPRGHGTDSAHNELGMVARHLATSDWFVSVASPASAELLADTTKHLHAGGISATPEAVRLLCAWAAPLHVAEATVRAAAAARLAVQAAGLPRVAGHILVEAGIRKSPKSEVLLEKDDVKRSGQTACRNALLAEASDARKASELAVAPPVKAMEQAWLISIWLRKSHQLMRVTELVEPSERAAIDSWLDGFYDDHSWLTPPEPPTQEQLLEWVEYKDGLIKQIGALVADKRLASLTRMFGEEIVQEALERAIGCVDRHPFFRGRYVYDAFYLVMREVKSAIRRESQRLKRELPIDWNDSSYPSFEDDEADMALTAATRLLDHLVWRFRADTVRRDEAADHHETVAKVVAECIERGDKCHSNQITRALQLVQSKGVAPQLVDQVIAVESSEPWRRGILGGGKQTAGRDEKLEYPSESQVLKGETL